jgi:hypothetical protein
MRTNVTEPGFLVFKLACSREPKKLGSDDHEAAQVNTKLLKYLRDPSPPNFLFL